VEHKSVSLMNLLPRPPPHSLSLSLSQYSNCEAGNAGPVGGSCAPCATGKYAAIDGATECVACTAGKYAAIDGATECVACTAGKYTASDGATAESECVACTAGKYTASDGEADCVACTASPGRYCPVGFTSAGGEICPAGFYCPGGDNDKMPWCAAGTYNGDGFVGGRYTSCTSCPAGKFSEEGVSHSVCLSVCLSLIVYSEGLPCESTGRMYVWTIPR
jgi:hypothetical protein